MATSLSVSLLCLPHGQTLTACGFKFLVWILLWANAPEAKRTKNNAMCLFANPLSCFSCYFFLLKIY
nr:MAG TPA: hypothetical protein [Caudoviricetes sp.]